MASRTQAHKFTDHDMWATPYAQLSDEHMIYIVCMFTAPPTYACAIQSLPDPLPLVPSVLRDISFPSSQEANDGANPVVVLRPPEHVVFQSQPSISGFYEFIPYTSNSMILLPREHDPELGPQYHISIGYNVFRPSSQVTTIRRGRSEHGPFVGSFELFRSPSTHIGTVCLGDRELILKNVLLRKDEQCRYDWKFRGNGPLRWHLCSDVRDSKLHIQCTENVRDGDVLAHLYPAKLRVPGRRHRPALLRVLPAGETRLDEIVVSCLVVEGLRAFNPQLH
ncbi:hypothetical protein BV22DRAFT_59374 [Leucogyrophana mollusca]|uniref:Uncharacterized protein n=1 Tax=Leucogyrophana mollusca TaxID=85980 RepID=A0ACB8BXB0_9AGAM|nr:hypothetical protein BV22DRAFT_59374 [Leucogyrophana mollusca]